MDTKDIVGRGTHTVADICSKNFVKKIIGTGYAVPNDIKCKSARNTKICCLRTLWEIFHGGMVMVKETWGSNA